MTEIIPHNTNLRMSGVVSFKEFIQQSDPEFDYREIYPTSNFRLDLPSELGQKWTSYLRPKLATETKAKPASIAKIPHGRLLTNNNDMVAYITREGKVLSDVSFQYVDGKTTEDASQNRAFKVKYFTSPRIINGTVFPMLPGGGGVHNYFHWLFDVLLRFHLLEKSDFLQEVDYFVVPNYQKSFQRETLKILGIREDQIIEATYNMHLRASQLIVATHPRSQGVIPEWCPDFFRQKFSEIAQTSRRFAKRVYISRRDSQRRNVLNEEELTDTLNTYGFESYVMSDLSVEEQVALFSQAECIISAHGAALANLVFCNPGAKVIELFSEAYVYPLYYHLADRSELIYDYLIFPSNTTAEHPKLGEKIHINADIIRIEGKVKEILNL